jgi:hypothetical protein
MKTSENESLPLYSVYDPNGKPYLSVIPDANTVRIQLHEYDQYMRPVFLTLDRRSIPELIKALENIE